MTMNPENISGPAGLNNFTDSLYNVVAGIKYVIAGIAKFYRSSIYNIIAGAYLRRRILRYNSESTFFAECQKKNP